MLYALPSGGRPIRLIVPVRRFFCQQHTGAQKSFGERLPTLCRPHVPRTTSGQKPFVSLGSG